MEPLEILPLGDFLSATAEIVAQVAPSTAVYMVGGSRRRAILEGIPLDDTYLVWTRPQMVENIALFFRFGVQHLIFPCVGPRQFEQVGAYRERLLDWLVESLTGSDMLMDYQRHNWRVRMLVPASIPALVEAAQWIEQATANHGPATVWLYLVADHEEPWRDLIAAIHRSGAQTYEAAVQALYGEVVPPATMYIGFGRPQVGTTSIPLLLEGHTLECYWTERAGCWLTETVLRRIIYDYAYLRPTRLRERSGRYKEVSIEQQRLLWNQEAIIGEGVKIGSFWYPQPFPDLVSDLEKEVGGF